MKICYILSQMHSPGGVERTIHNRLMELSKKYEVYLITIEQGSQSYYFGKIPNVNYIDLNMNYERHNKIYMKKNFQNSMKIVQSFFKLKNTLDSIKPHITVNLGMGRTFYFLPFIKSAGELIYEHHASFYHLGFDKTPPNQRKIQFFNKYKKHVFLSEEEKNLASFITTEKYVIPNPVPSNLPMVISYPNKRNRIIAAGRYVDIKGFDRLIEAWRRIYDKAPTWILEIYADKDEIIYPRLIKFIQDNNLQDKTFLKPSTNDILHIINDSKIYAMVSHFENFPMVMLEALSLGTINVAFDCPSGPRNIINDRTGYLVTNDNVDLYAQTLLEVIKNTDEAEIKSRAALKASQYYTLKKIVAQWVSILN